MRSPLPDVGELAARIQSVFLATTPEQRAEGRAWYREAHALAWSLAIEHGVSIEAAAGVIAALSPNLEWGKNKEYAALFLATGDAPVLGNSKRNATRIVAGESPLEVLNGPKTRAFFQNIADPERSDAVCIDRHAHDLALGERYGDRPRPVLGRKGGYDRLADAYRAVARQFGIPAHDVQAITWVAWRAA